MHHARYKIQDEATATYLLRLHAGTRLLTYHNYQEVQHRDGDQDDPLEAAETCLHFSILAFRNTWMSATRLRDVEKQVSCV